MPGEMGIDSLLFGVWEVLVTTGPLLAVVLLTSLGLNLLQASTQLQDPTLSIIPRLLIGAIVLLYALPWMIDRLAEFTRESILHVATGGS